MFGRRAVGRALLFWCAASGLAACGGEDEIAVLTCPQVLIVDEASRLTLHAPGEGRDLRDVGFDAGIDAVDWRCEFHTEENRVDVEIRFGVRAMRGPAADGPAGRFPYFVAVADPLGDVLAKRTFAIEIEFPGNAAEIGHVETIVQKLPYDRIADASKHTIYIGFQLTAEQLGEIRAGESP